MIKKFFRLHENAIHELKRVLYEVWVKLDRLLPNLNITYAD